MPKFLSELTPRDWLKIIGFVAMAVILYKDVHSSIDGQKVVNTAQEKKLAEIETTLKSALENQSSSSLDLSNKLGEINQKLGVIGESTRQLEERTKRIERKL